MKLLPPKNKIEVIIEFVAIVVLMYGRVVILSNLWLRDLICKNSVCPDLNGKIPLFRRVVRVTALRLAL